jgi:hypothetical protein
MAAFPTITPSTISLTPVNATKITATLNGIEQRAVGSGQYYRITATYASMTKAQIRQILGHVAEHSGPLDSFTYALPTYLGTRTGSGTSLVTSGSTTAGAISTTLSVVSGSTPYLKAGDLFKFATHDKVYQCIADANTTTLSFRPPLRTTVPTSTALTISNLSMTVRYATDNQEFAIGTDEYTSITLEFIEVLS